MTAFGFCIAALAPLSNGSKGPEAELGKWAKVLKSQN
jgi:hypothetical protein